MGVILGIIGGILGGHTWYDFSCQEWTEAQATSCYGTWHAASFVPAPKQHQHAGCNLLQKQVGSKNILLSKQVVYVCACLHVGFMQKSCKNILFHQKSHLHTFLGHCRG